MTTKHLKYKNATRKTLSLIEQLRVIASESQMRAKHCAALVYNNKIIAITANEYGKNINSLSIHAEQNLHKKYLKIKHKLKTRRKYELWVFRFSTASGIMNSKPCANCTKFIRNKMEYINKVCYSYNDKYYICEDPSKLKTKHISVGHQHQQKTNRLKRKCNC